MNQTFGPDRTDPSNGIFMPRDARSGVDLALLLSSSRRRPTVLSDWRPRDAPDYGWRRDRNATIWIVRASPVARSPSPRSERLALVAVSFGAGKIFAVGRIELVVGDRVRGGSRSGSRTAVRARAPGSGPAARRGCLRRWSRISDGFSAPRSGPGGIDVPTAQSCALHVPHVTRRVRTARGLGRADTDRAERRTLCGNC
jgi:hypothetical protein